MFHLLKHDADSDDKAKTVICVLGVRGVRGSGGLHGGECVIFQKYLDSTIIIHQGYFSHKVGYADALHSSKLSQIPND